MKPETIKYILKLLETELEDRKSLMLRVIESRGSDAGVLEKVAYYQDAYRALDDFKDWIDEQEDN